MLKLIKFINAFVPKMSLATSVLSHGLGDLVMFTAFFCFTIFAFAQMFYIQLGPYLDDCMPHKALEPRTRRTLTALLLTRLSLALDRQRHDFCFLLALSRPVRRF